MGGAPEDSSPPCYNPSYTGAGNRERISLMASYVSRQRAGASRGFSRARSLLRVSLATLWIQKTVFALVVVGSPYRFPSPCALAL